MSLDGYYNYSNIQYLLPQTLIKSLDFYIFWLWWYQMKKSLKIPKWMIRIRKSKKDRKHNGQKYNRLFQKRVVCTKLYIYDFILAVIVNEWNYGIKKESIKYYLKCRYFYRCTEYKIFPAMWYWLVGYASKYISWKHGKGDTTNLTF